MTDQKTNDGATGPIEWDGNHLLVSRGGPMTYRKAEAADLVAALQANAALRAEVLSRLQAESDSENYWHIRGEGAERREVELRELLRLAESELAEAKAELGKWKASRNEAMDAATLAITMLQTAKSELAAERAGVMELLLQLRPLADRARDNTHPDTAAGLATSRIWDTLLAFDEGAWLRSPQQPARPATEAEYRPMFGDLVTGLYGPGVVVELLPGKQCRVQLHTGKAELCDWSDLELRAEPAAEQVAPLTREQADEALGEELERHPVGGHGRQVAPPPVEPPRYCEQFRDPDGRYDEICGNPMPCAKHALAPAAEQAGAAGGERWQRVREASDRVDVWEGDEPPCPALAQHRSIVIGYACPECGFGPATPPPQADSRMLGPVEAFRQELIAALRAAQDSFDCGYATTVAHLCERLVDDLSADRASSPTAR